MSHSTCVTFYVRQSLRASKFTCVKVHVRYFEGIDPVGSSEVIAYFTRVTVTRIEPRLLWYFEGTSLAKA